MSSSSPAIFIMMFCIIFIITLIPFLTSNKAAANMYLSQSRSSRGSYSTILKGYILARQRPENEPIDDRNTHDPKMPTGINSIVKIHQVGGVEFISDHMLRPIDKPQPKPKPKPKHSFSSSKYFSNLMNSPRTVFTVPKGGHSSRGFRGGTSNLRKLS